MTTHQLAVAVSRMVRWLGRSDTPYGHRAPSHAIIYMQGLLKVLALGGPD